MTESGLCVGVTSKAGWICMMMQHTKWCVGATAYMPWTAGLRRLMWSM